MVVDRQALVARKADRRGGVLAVRAGVGKRMQVDGRDGAVVHGAQLNGHLHLVARVARSDGLLAGVAAVARTAGLLGDERHEDLAAARLLGAKAAADARLNDLHLRLRNVERLRDHAAHVKGTCVEVVTEMRPKASVVAKARKVSMGAVCVAWLV